MKGSDVTRWEFYSKKHSGCLLVSCFMRLNLSYYKRVYIMIANANFYYFIVDENPREEDLQ